MVMILASAVPAFAINYTTDGFFTTLDVQEDSSMHVTEEIYVTFTSSAHGIYRYIPRDDVKAYFMYGGELQSAPMVYKIKNIKVEEEYFREETYGSNLVIRIGSADKTITGAHKYKLEYDIVMYEDGIDYLDQLYWNVVPAYWETDIDFAAFTVNMPKAFDESKVDVITGPVGTGDTSRASWDVDGNYSLAGHVDGLEAGEGITVRITLPEGYWTGAKSETVFWRIAQGVMAGLTAFAVILFLKKGRDPKPVQTVEFYPPDNLSPAEIGYIYDTRIDDKDMTSLVMWFASKGYLRIHAGTTETKILKKEKVVVMLEKLKDLPGSAPAYQRTFFDALFEESKLADMDKLSESTEFADSYEAAKTTLQERYNGSKSRKLQEGYGYMALGCLTWLLMLGVLIAAIAILFVDVTQAKILIGEFIAGGIIVILCTIFMSRPTEFRTQMMGRIKGFREFIELAELDKINRLVEKDPNYFYDILPYAYVFGLTDKWAKNFEQLAPKMPDWYDGPAYYMTTPSVFCRTMDNGVRSALSESVVHTTSSSDFSGGGSFSSGGGGFSGGGGGGGGGGAW
jgi:uncharacterized membrane protein YgcG